MSFFALIDKYEPETLYITEKYTKNTSNSTKKYQRRKKLHDRENVNIFPTFSYFGHFTSWGDPIFKNNTIFFNLKLIKTQWKRQFLD